MAAAMKPHDLTSALDVRDATVATTRFDNVSVSNRLFQNSKNANIADMTINSVDVGELLQAYEAAKSAGGK